MLNIIIENIIITDRQIKIFKINFLLNFKLYINIKITWLNVCKIEQKRTMNIGNIC